MLERQRGEVAAGPAGCAAVQVVAGSGDGGSGTGQGHARSRGGSADSAGAASGWQCRELGMKGSGAATGGSGLERKFE